MMNTEHAINNIKKGCTKNKTKIIQSVGGGSNLLNIGY